MKDSGFLIVNNKGIVGFKKGSKGPSWAKTFKTPALAPGERAVFITVDVADRIFGNNILDTPKQDGGLVTSSTARVPIVEFGTMGIATNWLGFLEIRTMWSIMLGIHQAKNNEGRILEDSA